MAHGLSGNCEPCTEDEIEYLGERPNSGKQNCSQCAYYPQVCKTNFIVTRKEEILKNFKEANRNELYNIHYY